MTNKIFYLSILILSCISCKTETKTKSEILEKSKIDKIDSLANRYLELNRFSGVILVTKGDTIIYNHSFGLADYDNDKPFSNKTTFKIGEISELVTANIIREMAKKNKFKLSDEISKYIPEIKSDFTINDLLNHKTNLPSLQIIQEQNPELVYSNIDYANLAIQSSAISEQSDLNYNILGLIIEKVSGKTFQENLETYSKELSLENTYFQKSDTSLAVGYLYHNYQDNGPELQKAPDSNTDITFSSNGLKSTATDLVKIISANSTDKLEIEGYLENDGFSYSIVNNPETKIAIIVLSNRRHPIAKEISTSIDEILENKEYTLPLARKEIDIDTKLLKDYSGIYSLNENMNLEVINKNDSLFVMFGTNKIHLLPQSANQFYMEQTDGSMRFLRDTNNVVNEVVLLDGFLEGNTIKRVEK
ncbi:serine hydrolase domain-containing protein [Gillisia limnaea]|uniref:Beta-lactamase n=1 Tax=Gillisia limnaea (strain DSM 15749 / LMG 21470 / R-8282) TaxID=865937 RepID=H2BXE7_GILLR|nr:serine hydrolase domain-containing protein [Gillisia limnaea]EHQ02029.1 beta-lactamase [Gillisia limnaea DSM 15749]